MKKVYVHSSVESKLSAFIALCEIVELVMDAEEEVGKALKSSFSDNSLEDSTKAIVKYMTAAERARLRGPEATELGERLEDLGESAERGYGVFST